jgi:myo-inositol-1(or 4)-monophosphatase
LHASSGTGIEIHYLENPPFPMTEFTLKAGRVQYVTGGTAMVARLREILGR